ncbi:MAG: DUF354 domain-containing protein [Candidatus Moduliflexus flocculans]|nr:DUF354 domain-containing protein [Candidatus Moduliflexus flocculans]
MLSKLNWIAELDIEYSCSDVRHGPVRAPVGRRRLHLPLPERQRRRHQDLRRIAVHPAPGPRAVHHPQGEGHRDLEAEARLDRGEGRHGRSQHPSRLHDLRRGRRRTRRIPRRAVRRAPRLHPDPIRGPVLAGPAPGNGPFLEDGGGARVRAGSTAERAPRRADPAAAPAVKIWIDLDNTPHVPFFVPIIRELERRGHEVVLSARDAFQVCDLAEKKGLSVRKIGRHYGKNLLLKVSGLFIRALQLLPFYLQAETGAVGLPRVPLPEHPQQPVSASRP